MNKTFNINLGGYPFAIDEDAFEYIQNYLHTIRQHFSTSEGCDEILYDIEVRMAELFQEHLKGRSIISMKEIDEVIMIMGKPEDFGAQPMSESYIYNSRNKKSDIKINTGKRLFRDPDDQKIAGVCSGIAAYFGIEDPLWIRLLFAALFFTGAGVITYFVLWILVPEAKTAGDKLSMRGEPATISNIAKVVEEEINELGDKIQEWSKDLNGKKKSDSNNTDKHAFRTKAFLAKGVNAFGLVASGIIPTMRRVIKPIIVTTGILLISALAVGWAASFVGLSFASPLLMTMGPDSRFVSWLGIGSLFFTIGLPILGLILLIARLSFFYRINKHVNTSLWVVWFVSLFVTMYAGMSTAKEYRSYHVLSTVSDYNILSPDIQITMPEENIDHSNGIVFDNFFGELDKHWAIKDVHIQIEKSKDALVHIEKKISSRGEVNTEAEQNTLFVGNDIKVNEGVISISKYLTIPKDRKYRNQSVDYVIFVPEGKNIIFDHSLRGYLSHSQLFDRDMIYSSTENMKWKVTGNGIFSKEYNDIHHYNKEVATDQYNKIIIENGYDVIIKKGDKPKVNFSGNKELVDKISVKNLDGTLIIATKDNELIEDVTLHIETPSLELIQLHGVKSTSVEGFNQDNMKILAIGTENGFDNDKINISGKIKNLDLNVDGNQYVYLTGSGENISAVINDGAVISADKFIVNQAAISGNHTHESSFFVQQFLKCVDPEMVDFKVYGQPKKEKL